MSETLIRTRHPDGFRSGQWAALKCTVPSADRDCHLVEFPDGVTDFWAADDPDGQYEFAIVTGETPEGDQ